MPPNNKSPTLSLYLIITNILILINVPTSLCDDNQKYVACGQLFQCRDINANYPFWGGNRPDYCGLPEFQLNCQNNDPPILTIQARSYRVLSIDNRTQTLTVAREEFWNNTCPSFLYNATLDTNLFNYGSNTQNLRLFYACPTLPFQGQEPIPPQFNCTLNGTISVNYYEYATSDTDPSNTNLGTCNSSVVVPVFQSAALGLMANPPSTNVSTALAGGFALQWIAENNNCTQCVQSGGRCGYNSSSRSFTCYCSDQAYSLRCNSTPNGDGGVSTALALPFIIGLLLQLGAIVVLAIICCRKKCLLNKSMNHRKEQTLLDQNVEAFIRNYGSLAPNWYNYLDIKKMTNSFREKLGQGGYGSVYKGKLDGRLVAVKLLSETNGGNGEDFVNEVASISRTSHVNVVTLLGFCYEGQKRALLYEFMPNGSLDKFITNDGSPNTNSHLDCKTLYQIAVGIARGLEYLHRGCNTRIVHFDIKPHNILLDEDFCPKISDFGLAKLCQLRKESILLTMGARGTVGYIAPEVFCRNFGRVSYKSDVYSYGMMVLEMIGAREKVEVGSDQMSETYFPDWIYEHLETGNDLRLNAITIVEEKEMARKMILVSLWCIQTNPSDRPTMSKVVEMLEGSLESLQIPPKPYLFSMTRSAQDSSITLSEVLGSKELSVR